ncbi:MAG TPA: tRNA pseudouridine(13) synthase TruD [Gammaproteobacteria bacterium]|nr:tRNA pseudouridine(13) synthase TruD [Gammaproteobacteria bacterium]
MQLSLPDWPRAGGRPPASARLRQMPEDFQVEEVLGFAPSGEGQHVLLRLRKRNANTEWVACQLARLAGVGRRSVGYAGLKDRHAVTTQWFSVDLAGRAVPDWGRLAEMDIEVLSWARHDRKLRHGAVRANRFRIVLRGLNGDRAALVTALERIAREGSPNYFGPQRFGRDNLRQAAAMLLEGRPVRDRFRRGIYLSTARAWLFNRVLARRVTEGCWNEALPGDVMMLEGSHSIFPCPRPDADLRDRLATGDIHPTGPLWGSGDSPVSAAAAALETAALEEDRALCHALATAGLRQQRRALRIFPRELQWQMDGDTLTLGFILPAGGYATSVLREAVEFRTED